MINGIFDKSLGQTLRVPLCKLDSSVFMSDVMTYLPLVPCCLYLCFTYLCISCGCMFR